MPRPQPYGAAAVPLNPASAVTDSTRQTVSTELDWTDDELRLRGKAKQILLEFAALQRQLGEREGELLRVDEENAALAQQAAQHRQAVAVERQRAQQREQALRAELARLNEAGVGQLERIGAAAHDGESLVRESARARDTELAALAAAKAEEDRAARQRYIAQTSIPEKAAARVQLLSSRLSELTREVQSRQSALTEAERENDELRQRADAAEAEFARTKAAAENASMDAESRLATELRERSEDKARYDRDSAWMMSQLDKQGEAYRAYVDRLEPPGRALGDAQQLQAAAAVHSAKAAALEQQCGVMQARLDVATRELELLKMAEQSRVRAEEQRLHAQELELEQLRESVMRDEQKKLQEEAAKQGQNIIDLDMLGASWSAAAASESPLQMQEATHSRPLRKKSLRQFSSERQTPSERPSLHQQTLSTHAPVLGAPAAAGTQTSPPPSPRHERQHAGFQTSPPSSPRTAQKPAGFDSHATSAPMNGRFGDSTVQPLHDSGVHTLPLSSPPPSAVAAPHLHVPLVSHAPGGNVRVMPFAVPRGEDPVFAAGGGARPVEHGRRASLSPERQSPHRQIGSPTSAATRHPYSDMRSPTSMDLSAWSSADTLTKEQIRNDLLLAVECSPAAQHAAREALVLIGAPTDLLRGSPSRGRSPAPPSTGRPPADRGPPDEAVLLRSSSERMGCTWRNATLELAGVVAGSAAERQGLGAYLGRRVTHINGSPVHSVQQIAQIAQTTSTLRLRFAPAAA